MSCKLCPSKERCQLKSTGLPPLPGPNFTTSVPGTTLLPIKSFLPLYDRIILCHPLSKMSIACPPRV